MTGSPGPWPGAFVWGRKPLPVRGGMGRQDAAAPPSPRCRGRTRATTRAHDVRSVARLPDGGHTPRSMRTLRIGLAQINPTVGDLDGNVALILETIERARALGVELLAFP